MPSLPCISWLMVRKMPKAESRLRNVFAYLQDEKTSAWESAFVCLDHPLSSQIIVPSRTACEYMNPCGVECTASKAVPELVCKWDTPQLVLHCCGRSLSGKNADLGAVFAVSFKILYLSLVAFCFKATAYPCVCLLVLPAVSGHN